MHRIVSTGLAGLVLSCASIAAADGFDYTYLEGGYVNTEIDTSGVDVDGDGFGIRGSFALDDRFHMFAGYADQDFDFGIDVAQFEIGGGYHQSINENLDWVATASYLDVDLDTSFGDASEDGFGLGIGLRGRLPSGFELEGTIDYVDVGDSDTSFTVEGRYPIAERLWIGAGVTFDDDGTGFAIGLRYTFPRSTPGYGGTTAP